MQHGILPVLAMAFCLWAGGSALASGAENGTTIGVATANIAWEEPSDVRKIFAEIADAGFTAVRIGFKNPVQSSHAAMIAAKEAGLDILVTFPLIDGSVSANGAEPRARTGRYFQAYGLSQIDPLRFRTRFNALLDFIAGRQIPVIGLEFGNELNWSGYNGDLPLGEVGNAAHDWHDLSPEIAARFEAGIAKYHTVLDIAKVGLAARPSLSRVTIISAGLADINAAFIRRSGATYLAPHLVYDAYARQQIFSAVEAVGIHLYEPLRAASNAAERPGMIEAQLGGCGEKDFAHRPCWITEFGSALPQHACAPDDSQRIALLRPLLNRLARPEEGRAIPYAFYYDWNADEGFALKRCGHPTALVDTLSNVSRRSGEQ